MSRDRNLWARRSRTRSPLSRLRAASALSIAVALSALSAHAQQPPADAAAEATFKRGLELFDARDFGGAASVWETLVPPGGGGRWKVLYNLGLAYQAAADATRAIERFEAFAAAVEREATRPPELEERRQDALERVRALKAANGALQILAPRSGAAPVVRIDGGAPRAAGFTVWLPVGSHVVVIGEGPQARRVEIQATAGAVREVDTTPPAAPPLLPTAEPRPPDPLPPTEGRSFPTLWVLLGVAATGASVALPLALRGDAEDARVAAEELGPGHTGYPAAVDEYESSRSTYYAGWALPAALGAITLGIAVYGVVHLATAPTPASQSGKRARLEWGAGASSHAGGAWMGGAF